MPDQELNGEIFPVLYHAHHQEYEEDLPFWLALAHRKNGPVLELGCGTGRVLIPLAQQGYPICGLDHDPHMLAVLKQNLPPTKGKKVDLFQGDFRDFDINMKFDLIILPCNTFSTLERSERQSLLKSVHRHLSPEGIFAVSIPNPQGLISIESNLESDVETTFIHPLTGNPVQVGANWEKKTSSVEMHWFYDHLLPDGKIERLTTTIRHTLTPNQTYLDEFKEIGFSIQATYGDFDKSEYTSSSPYLIVILNK